MTEQIHPSIRDLKNELDDDELVEITPQSVRLRKIHLRESDRKRHSRTIQSDAANS